MLEGTWSTFTRYRTLLITFTVFTILDTVTTMIGLEVGCVELNPIVLTLGVGLWVIFRLLLLACMVTTFFLGYRLCSIHYQKGVRVLRTILIVLNLFIVAVVFTGFIAIITNLIFIPQ